MAGTLALVVGPSGAGKDALIAGARTVLAGDSRFVFVRRVVTREAVASIEDHDSVDGATFAALDRQGAFALAWDAHGLSYGLPAGILDETAAGRIAVANVSRSVIFEAVARFGTIHVLLVEAPSEVRAARLGSRGREDTGAVASRLSREVSDVPTQVPITRIDNSGALEAGVAVFVATLKAIAGEPRLRASTYSP